MKRLDLNNEPAIELNVEWHGQEFGRLLHDGLEWHWSAITSVSIPLIKQTIPGKLPPFISSLLPEGWLESVLNNSDDRMMLCRGRRYLSNITITPTLTDFKELPPDILETNLEQYTKGGLFTGFYTDPTYDGIESSFEKKLSKIFSFAETPLIPGAQIKAPMFLDQAGNLSPSITDPFTHILKPAGVEGFEQLPLVEWLALDLARRCNFQVPAFALLVMHNDLAPALVVERFDIRQDLNDQRQIALADFCSLMDISSADKYNKTIEQSAKALKAVSTSPEDDLLILFKRALFAWLIADGDMHTKNLAVLKIAEQGADTFASVRMTPIYDPVTTVVFPGLKHDLLALKMCGKNNRLNRADFKRLAATIGIPSFRANSALEELTNDLQKALEDISLPKGVNYTEAELSITEHVRNVCESRLAKFIKTRN